MTDGYPMDQVSSRCVAGPVLMLAGASGAKLLQLVP